jgi:hypothetical protein
VRREYRFVLSEQFVEVRNTSTYAAQEKNPKDEVHDDVGYLSNDRSEPIARPMLRIDIAGARAAWSAAGPSRLR